MMRRALCFAGPFVAACINLGIQRPASAVSTSYWTQTSEADFKAGTLEGVVATNLGELKLSRAVKTLLEQDPQISNVNKLIEAPDGTIYAGTGPNAVLLQIKDQKVSQVAKIDDATDILSMAFDKQGRLLLGTGGEKGRVLRVDKPGDKPHEIFSADDVQYIWALQVTPDGNIYAATGPSGKLYEITDAASKVLFETEENNLLSLATDGKQYLYAGTDPHGLVYRIDRKTGDGFVLYNAVESEVTALVLDKQGNLYAATAEARDESPQPPAMPDEDKNGRPEGGATGVPIPGEKGQAPKEPAPPDPNPGRPDPIPKGDTMPAIFHRKMRSAFTARRADARVVASITRQALSDTRCEANVFLAVDMEKNGPGGNKPKPNPQPPAPPNKPQPAPPTSQTAPGVNNPGAAHQPNVDASQSGEPREEGNAVYKIDTDGFVTEVFRQNVLVLGMVENNGTLLLATGSEGQIYQVNPAAGETIVVAKVDPKQVTCLLPARDGNIYMGMANVGSVAMMSAGYANKGSFTSPVLDATQISRFGKMQLRGALPQGTTITMSTRSGNVKEASEKNWSKWTEPVAAAEYLPVGSPTARFLQYRLSLTSKDGKSTPLVDDVSIAYQVPNMAPQIKAIRLAGAPDPSDNSQQQQANGNGAAGSNIPAPTHHVTIAWDAADPNGDALQYTLYFRRGLDEPWILLKDELTDASYDWDTRAVADGRYEVKVVASDALANAPGAGKTATRVSDPVLVDNTPPVIGDIKWAQKGDVVHIDLRAFDRSSTVAAVEYAVDSAKNWQLVLPTTQLYDSPEATIAADLKNLSPGQHQIALRATDSRGNQSFENVFVKVEGPAASR